MNTKDIEEIVEEFGENLLNYMNASIAFCAVQEDVQKMAVSADDEIEWCKNYLRTTLTTLTQHHQAEVERAVEAERERIRNEVLYDVDVEKIPSIQDEAWANQFDSKAEAFWYGQAQYRKDIVKDLDK